MSNKQAKRTRRMPDKRQHTGKNMSLVQLLDWELGSRACGELLSQNGPAPYGALLQRLYRAWPYSRLVGKIIRLNDPKDQELYHVKEFDKGELIADQLTYPVNEWPDDGVFKEWSIDPSAVAEAMDWEEVK